ncbi:MAG: histidine phosphatase family protein [Sulfitobacter sp.]
MKRLILMRHAKSDWSGGAASDHDRPLNARGQHSSVALGHWLRAQDLLPDQVISSSAKRTGETFLGLGLPQNTAVSFTRDLYLATHHEIMGALRSATGEVVLILGHNPGISIMAAEILDTPPDHPQFDAYPTGATLVADFDIARWRDAGWGKAIARHFVVPRDL